MLPHRYADTSSDTVGWRSLSGRRATARRTREWRRRRKKYLGGVLEIVVPDQFRSAVIGLDRYDAELDPTYLELA